MSLQIQPPAPDSPDDAHLPHPITLLINGNSRTGRDRFDEAVSLLREAGITVKDAVLAQDKAETEQVLKREIERKSRMVIIGGGDGTLSTCAGYLAGSEVAMAVIPLGTGNTFARSIGLQIDMKGAIETIASGRIVAVDVGKCNDQIFLNSVSLGLSAEIASALTGDVKKKLGLLAWPVIGGKIVARHRSMKLRILSEERNFSVRTHQLMIANGRYVAGPIIASEEASLQNRELTVFALGGAGKAGLIRAVWHWLRRTHRKAAEVPFFETKQLRVQSLGRRIAANIDGEISGHTPLELSVWPGALRVVVPQDFVADEV